MQPQVDLLEGGPIIPKPKPLSERLPAQQYDIHVAHDGAGPIHLPLGSALPL